MDTITWGSTTLASAAGGDLVSDFQPVSRRRREVVDLHNAAWLHLLRRGNAGLEITFTVSKVYASPAAARNALNAHALALATETGDDVLFQYTSANPWIARGADVLAVPSQEGCTVDWTYTVTAGEWEQASS